MHLPLIEYREYTTEGRLIATPYYTTTVEYMRDDLEALLDPDLTVVIENEYARTGIIEAGEMLKDLWPTNIIVRDTKTGRFIKWKNI